jgi:hypothetical protein
MDYNTEITYLINQFKNVFKIFSNFLIFHFFLMTIHFFNDFKIDFIKKLLIVTIFPVAFLILEQLKNIMFVCNNKSYSLKCQHRKMEILLTLNKRLYEKVLEKDNEFEKKEFFKSKSYFLYIGFMKIVQNSFIIVSF